MHHVSYTAERGICLANRTQSFSIAFSNIYFEETDVNSKIEY